MTNEPAVGVECAVLAGLNRREEVWTLPGPSAVQWDYLRDYQNLMMSSSDSVALG